MRAGDVQAFRDIADTAEFFDSSKAAAVVLPYLTPTPTPISMRPPDALLTEIHRVANEQDVPFQAFPRVFLADQVQREQERRPPNMRLQRTAAKQYCTSGAIVAAAEPQTVRQPKQIGQGAA